MYLPPLQLKSTFREERMIVKSNYLKPIQIAEKNGKIQENFNR